LKTVFNKVITRISAVILWGLFFVPCASSAGVTLPPLDIHTLELPNGLHAVLVDRGDAPVITVEIWYHVGSRNEQPGKTGFAHVLEHMMFDGTRTIGRHFSDYIVRVGGIDNAYTTTDATVYWETMPTTNLPVALWLEADRMRNLDINQGALDNERRVIADERRRRYENPPYGTVIPTLYGSAFSVSPYRHLPIGSVDDVNGATVQDIRDFYNTYYVPNNATVVIAGSFSIEDAERDIKKYFGPLKVGTRPISPAIPTEPPQTSQRLVTMARDVALPAFVEAFHVPADGTPDSFPLRLASRILSAGDSGWIYHQLVYEKQLALEAQSSADFSEDPNLFFVFAIMNTGYKLADGEAAVSAILKRLQEKPLSPKELEKAKDQVLFELAADREKSKDLAEQLGYDAVILNNPQAINTEPARFQAVTAEQVQAAARKYFVSQNMTLLEVHIGQAARTNLNLQAGGK
jgi:zinc protease